MPQWTGETFSSDDLNAVCREQLSDWVSVTAHTMDLFIHSFIPENFHSASSSPLLLRGVPDTARIYRPTAHIGVSR